MDSIYTKYNNRFHSFLNGHLLELKTEVKFWKLNLQSCVNMNEPLEII